MAPEIRLTAEWVAAAMAGTIVDGDGRREFAGVSIDTRTLAPGAVYIAIRGERFDGADFAADAVAAGAAGVVVARERAEAVATANRGARDSRPVTIAVDDTTVALQALSRAVRVASGTKVVAITGSAGKTTTKEVTAAFLETKYRVIRNHGNLNNHIGLPLSLIELTSRPDVAVVELGHEPRGRDSHARPYRRAGCPCLDQRRRRACGILRVGRRDRRREGRDSRRRDGRRRSSSPTRTTIGSPRGRRRLPDGRDVRHRAAGHVRADSTSPIAASTA